MENEITHLICNTNDFQSDILLKLFNQRLSYYSSMYLVDINLGHQEIFVKLLGNKLHKRKTYIININENTKKVSCSCQDFTFRCLKNNFVCKHITFLICKIVNIFDVEYFNTLILSDDNLQKIKNVLFNEITWNNGTISIKGINKDYNLTKNIDCTEKCMICFDFYKSDDIVINCPRCKNYIHKKCIDIWLSYNKNCVWCRQPWDNYVKNVEDI